MRRRSSFQKRRKQKIVLAGILIPLGIVILIFGTSFLLRRPFMIISKVNFIGNAVTTDAELESAVTKSIAGAYLGIFPKTNAFIFPKSDVEREIMSDFKRIASVEVKRDNLKTVSIQITERSPQALWCTSDINGTTVHFSSDCYFMDQTGYIFSPSPEFSPTALLRFYGYVKNDPIGTKYFSEAVFSGLFTFSKNVTMLGLKPLRVYYNSDGDFELYIEKGGKILFARDTDFQKSFSNLQTLLSDQQAKINNDGKLTVDYIDLRFGNKIYYK
ncbi:FtsQ-type POTRA domain-containing protein [Candidatus Parcubacteria bacterium]|nr:FtsQ-type POTRA domain-containing protein [Candidatus Parcubacteria bacterium]